MAYSAVAIAAAVERSLSFRRTMTVLALEEVEQTLLGVLGNRDLARRAVAAVSPMTEMPEVLRWLGIVQLAHDRTFRHSLLVAGLAAAAMPVLGIGHHERDTLLVGSLLHDVGKILVPAEIIDKPGRLLAGEMERVRRHAGAGHDLLAAEGTQSPEVLAIVRSHHEYLDGSGYPDRLTGNEISPAIRLVTLCDVFAALIEDRTYKAALSPIEASEIMASMAGKLDPERLCAFNRAFVR